MTETNINALCSVEAVFDGVDIEVTVEFSAGGGTFEHDELTAESREKADQHPIESITGLQSALDGKSNVEHGHDISDISGLTLADSPEFADTQITPLSVEATYTPTVWSYLVGLFTTVPKSVKEHIVKGWTVIENLKSRVTFLENNLILSIALTETVASLDINLPTPEYDIEVEVDYTADADWSSAANITVNDVIGNNYVSSTSQTYPGFISYVGRYASVGTYRFQVINGQVFCNTAIQQIWGPTSTQNVNSRVVLGYLKTAQAAINKIKFGHKINAGSVIKVRRVKRHA
jgi:hypothetical protein